MYRSTVAILLAFFLLMVVMFITAQAIVILPLVAQANQVEGEVEYSKKGQDTWQALQANQSVKEGDEVRTGTDGTALLGWMDGTKVKLDSNTSLTIRRCFRRPGRGNVSVFELDRGTVWTRIPCKLTEGSRFEVKTPGAVAGVRGTTFKVQVQDGETRLEVLEGEVELRAGKSKTLVQVGEAAVTDPSGRLVTRTLTEAEQQNWQALEDLLCPVLKVRAPEEGASLQSTTVVVKGVVEPEAGLRVQGQAVQPSDRGRFSIPIELSRGENTIVVEAENALGYRTERQVTVTVPQPAEIHR